VSEEIFVVRTAFWYDKIAFISECYADLDKKRTWCTITMTTNDVCYRNTIEKAADEYLKIVLGKSNTALDHIKK